MTKPAHLLTTHVGSLPRPQAVVDQVWAQDSGEAIDEAEFDRVITAGVEEVVRLQLANGIDIVNDGDMGKIGYATYIRHRLTGFQMLEAGREAPADMNDFPNFRDRPKESFGRFGPLRPLCIGPVTYENRQPLEDDLRRLTGALKAAGLTTGFMTAPSPGVITQFHPDRFYNNTEAYLFAAAEAMKTEYEAIVEAGLYLQLDAPDLAMGRHSLYRHVTDEEFVDLVDLHVAALNHAVRDIPADRMRMHLCWGNYEGPHTRDIGLEKIVAGILRAKPSILLFEGANPRHAHEWAVWRDIDIPEDKILVPGVIASSSNYVEHPKLIAERLGRFVEMVGPGRVMAGSDCGFGSWAGIGAVDPDICWAKFRSMAEGSAMAMA